MFKMLFGSKSEAPSVPSFAEEIRDNIAKLSDQNVQARRDAARVLRNLAYNRANQAPIREAGGIEPLIALLRNSDVVVTLAAAEAFGGGAANATNRHAIREAGGIKLLIALLRDSDAKVRRIAAWALRILAIGSINRDAIREAGGIEPLIELLRDSDANAREASASTLGILAENNPQNQAMMIDKGAAPLLGSLASSSGNARFTLSVCERLMESRKRGEKQSNTVPHLAGPVNPSLSSSSSKASATSNDSELESLRRQLAERDAEKAQAEARLAELSAKVEKTSLRPSGFVTPSIVPTISFASLQIDANERLGQGGFGVVYKGTWQMVTVAIKQLHATRLSPEALKSFEEEAQRHGLLHHPNVVMLFGVCVEPGRYMRLMAGGSLYDLLHSSKEMPWSLRLSIAHNISVGLY